MSRKERPAYKQACRNRDGSRCQMEGKHGGKITVDHKTPRSIYRVKMKNGESWVDGNPNRLENLQCLCQKHHTEKDRDTELRVSVLKAQLKGENFDLEKHMATFGLEPTKEDFELLLDYLLDN